MRRADIEVPNHPVDMDSWGRSACYPRGTFYPLSDTASTCRCRITSPDFRPCSTCQSHSQAPLCTCTRHLIANQVEGTFGPVSYTHLRAHETGRNLVCRLLLEKKKKHKQR